MQRFLLWAIVLWGALATVSFAAQGPSFDRMKTSQTLAYAYGVDDKCRVLSERERESLGRYVTKSELILVRSRAPTRVVFSLEKAKREGRTQTCTDRMISFVKETYFAARDGFEAAERDRYARKKDQKSHSSRSSSDMGQRSSGRRREPTVSNSQTDQYIRDLSLYYIHHRCPYLGRSESWDLWRHLKVQQKSLERLYGNDRIGELQKRARLIAHSPGACERARGLEGEY